VKVESVRMRYHTHTHTHTQTHTHTHPVSRVQSPIVCMFIYKIPLYAGSLTTLDLVHVYTVAESSNI
jgi:hypothetical protein